MREQERVPPPQPALRQTITLDGATVVVVMVVMLLQWMVGWR